MFLYVVFFFCVHMAWADIGKLLPTRTYCGLQQTDDRDYNQTETALDEFPWLVEVKRNNAEDGQGHDHRCSGVLISDRYVLTDFYCGYYAAKVTLGQYITSTNVSCIQHLGFNECTEATITVPVEEKFYWAKPCRSGRYNFYLLRLSKKINYSDFIRPICLPIDDSILPKQNETLILSGWGSKDSSAATKKRLIYTRTNNDVCYQEVSYLKGNIRSAKAELICLALQKSESGQPCNGDHGGAIMYSRDYQWFAHGIVIALAEVISSSYCSSDPAVKAIAITPEVIRWILEIMHD